MNLRDLHVLAAAEINPDDPLDFFQSLTVILRTFLGRTVLLHRSACHGSLSTGLGT